MTHLQAIGASPRAAGSAAAAAGQDYCAGHLEKLGFTTLRRRFSFSALTGRFGAPLAGGVAAASLIVLALIVRGGDRDLLALWGLALPLSWAFARKLQRGAFLDFAALRMEAVNLEAVRGSPRVWLVAHIDSKSQPISSAVRTSGVILLVIAWIVSFVAVMAGIRHPNPTLWNAVIWLAALGAVPLLISLVGNSSDGAADNASGVAAVLEAAELVPRHLSLGVLITDGEELGLAGAREWVKGREPGIAINCDTIDDDGALTLFVYDRSDADFLKRSTDAIAKSGALERASASANTGRVAPLRLMSPLPGVLTDSLAFRDASWLTLTLSAGNLRTLNRIHTADDNLQHLRGTKIPAAARVLATLVEELS